MTTQRIDPVALRGELEDVLVRAAGVGADALATAGDESLAELGLDSLAAMELQASVQAKFGVRIPDESLEMTLPELTHFVVAGLEGGA